MYDVRVACSLEFSRIVETNIERLHFYSIFGFFYTQLFSYCHDWFILICQVRVYYTGRLASGKIFDSTTTGNGFKFKLGKKEVISGWDVGLSGMFLLVVLMYSQITSC